MASSYSSTHRRLSIRQIFNSLAGTWALSRTISGFGKAEGEALFRWHASDLLLFEEKGILHYGEKRSSFFQSYFYAFQAGTICVYYKQDKKVGPVLHELKFENQAAYPLLAIGMHFCQPDTYQATYHFISPTQFSIEYQVNGPKKDYQLKTLFNKLG